MGDCMKLANQVWPRCATCSATNLADTFTSSRAQRRVMSPVLTLEKEAEGTPQQSTCRIRIIQRTSSHTKGTGMQLVSVTLAHLNTGRFSNCATLSVGKIATPIPGAGACSLFGMHQANKQQQFADGKVGYATSAGHIFPKKHGPPENMHIALCLDASTLRQTNRWETLVTGVEQFISARNKPKDVYSIVEFNGQGFVACDRVSPEQVQSRLTMMQPQFRQDTQFSSGLSVAYRQLMRTDWLDYRAALIFMSDGEDENSEWESSMLNIKRLAEERTLSTYVIGIGDGFGSRKLQSVATVGNAQFLTVDAVCENLTVVLKGIDAKAEEMYQKLVDAGNPLSRSHLSESFSTVLGSCDILHRTLKNRESVVLHLACLKRTLGCIG
ncbi:hypothetical protein Pelo_13799 [Pelomyxa schiedti]|nr:hypothetical protein Pelo_13799 [Pelomyxa schiedti]